VAARVCEEHRLAGFACREGECIGCALDEALRDREEAMRAIAKYDGRSWCDDASLCAVCGFVNEVCDEKTPNCLGTRARRLYPRKKD